MTARDDSARWLKRFRRDGAAAVRLFCFHHAGGTASLYRGWPRLMPRDVEPIAVQLPGRADRFREPPYETMPALVEPLVEVLGPFLDQPYAFYGLSMGGKVAWTLTHTLRDRAMPMPAALYLASVAAPALPEGRAGWNQADLVGYLREMGGTPPEVLSEAGLLASLLPTLRADLTLVDAFRFRPEVPLDMPIRAFAGGHFFDEAGERRVVRMVTDDLLSELATFRR